MTDFVCLVVDDDPSFLGIASDAFGGATVYQDVGEAQHRVDQGGVDLLVIGPSHAKTEHGVKQFGMFLDSDPSLPMVLVASQVTAPLLKAAMRAGLRDVIEGPLTVTKADEIMAELPRMPRRQQNQITAPARSFDEGTVLTISSAKGGSGKTVTATNLALLLANQLGPDRVVIVDADLQFGDVCLVLQLEPKYTIVNAVQDLHRLDESLLSSYITHHPSGLSVLAAPLEPAFADDISSRMMSEIIGKLRTMYDYVIVDTASLLDETLLSLLERADKVLYVVDMDLPSVKNAKLAFETLRLLQFPSDKISLILNRSNARARLDEREIERSLKKEILASVPSDGLVPASINEGRPVVESSPRSKVARGFESVALLAAPEVFSEDPKKRGRRRK